MVSDPIHSEYSQCPNVGDAMKSQLVLRVKRVSESIYLSAWIAAHLLIWTAGYDAYASNQNSGTIRSELVTPSISVSYQFGPSNRADVQQMLLAFANEQKLPFCVSFGLSDRKVMVIEVGQQSGTHLVVSESLEGTAIFLRVVKMPANEVQKKAVQSLIERFDATFKRNR